MTVGWNVCAVEFAVSVLFNLTFHIRIP